MINLTTIIIFQIIPRVLLLMLSLIFQSSLKARPSWSHLQVNTKIFQKDVSQIFSFLYFRVIYPHRPTKSKSNQTCTRIIDQKFLIMNNFNHFTVMHFKMGIWTLLLYT